MKKRLIIFSIIFIVLTITTSIFIFYLKKDNKELKSVIENQQIQTNSRLQTIEDENKKLTQKNQELEKENSSLTQEKQDLIQGFNEKNEKISIEAQTGNSKPNRTGISPQFTMVSRGGVNLSQRQNTLDNLAKGSYQYQKEEISFDIDDHKSWYSLGEWFVSCYTATTSECDSNPSITASGKLVTPSFTVAVDPNYWEYGTIFYFQDLGFGIAADSGGSVKGQNRADFLVASKTFANLASGNRQVFLVYTPPN
ncbi:MAG: 3D domain-containing protein [Candidatus Shapirobacteria bacterium]